MEVAKILSVVLILCNSALPESVETPEGHLATKVLTNYDRRVISRINNQPQLVYVGFTLVQLHSLDEKNQMLTSSGWFQMEWKDHRLMWNATQYNRTNIVVPSKELWLPDIGFLNSASIYHASMIRNEFRCVVYHDGSVLWVPGGTYYTTCELDISKFPFDKQIFSFALIWAGKDEVLECSQSEYVIRCYLHLTNWAYNIREMNLTMSSEEITMDSYKPSAEWKITKTLVQREEVVYLCCGNVSYPALYFYIWIERKSLYYVVNIIIPCLILSVLANFTFCVPPDCGEKISLGITLLLSFTVFQLIVAESIPRRSDSVPIISLYISLITAVVTASIICTIFISKLHHRGAEPMPNILRIVTFDIMARLVCLHSLRESYSRTRDLESTCRSKRLSHNGYGESTIKLKLLNGQSPMVETFVSDTIPENSAKSDAVNSGKHLQNIDNKLEQIIEALDEFDCRRIEEERMDAMKDQWRAAGKVFDRFFFVLYMTITAGVTTKFLVPVSGQSDLEQWGIKNV